MDGGAELRPGVAWGVDGTPEVVIVGGGLGGSMAALALVQAGLRVRVIETGGDGATPGAPAQGVWPRLRRKLLGRGAPAGPDRWPEPILLSRSVDGSKARAVRAVLGRGLGGSSTLYSAALGRLRRSDFETDRQGAPGEPQPLPNGWPVAYDAFRAAYRRAEAILRVAGERDPLDPDDDSNPTVAPPLSARDRAVHDALARNGAHPYRLRVAIDYRPGCGECIGRRCASGCKGEGASRALVRARAEGRVRIETHATVLRVEPGAGGPSVVLRTAAGRVETRPAAAVVLAAGALNTPLVLARSTALWGAGGPPATLGRGLMFHFSDFFTLRVSARLARGSIRKTLALRDGYASEAGGLGEIQSVGVDLSTGQAMTGLRDLARATLPRPLARLVEAARPAAWVFARLLGPAPILATIAEDLPYAENRVTEAPGAGPDDAPGRIQVTYAVTPGQKAAARARRVAVRRLFAPLRVIFLTRAVAPNLGHPMGTCRMGADPATSVVDAEGRVWGCPGVYVADASVFPSSGGVGPSLTVAAHALRVGDALARDLGASTATPVRAVTTV